MLMHGQCLVENAITVSYKAPYLDIYDKSRDCNNRAVLKNKSYYCLVCDTMNVYANNKKIDKHLSTMIRGRLLSELIER